MTLKIGYIEKDLRMKIKSLGSTWNPGKKMWALPYKYVKKLNLVSRIVWVDATN